VVNRPGYGTDRSLRATTVAGLHAEGRGRVGMSGEGGYCRVVTRGSTSVWVTTIVDSVVQLFNRRSAGDLSAI
jgi:hypothetical protein